MTPDNDRDADRVAREENVRRVVAFAALRRIHKLIATREEERRILRTWIVPVAAVVMLVLAVLIWYYANPYR
jgi:hypothetical protein